MTGAERRLQEIRGRVESALEGLFAPGAADPGSEGVPLLERAMAYSVLAGGKRLRPLLCVAACESAGGDPEDAVRPACALELLHTYSLIHDDLPCMDDDDLRRGRPTSHRVFGEALAVLAGDALQSLAFEILATHPPGDALAPRRTRVAREVALAIGWRGMAEGQVRDLQAEGRALPLAEILELDRRKTGALIRAAVAAGGILGGAEAGALEALGRYGESIGVCFQLVDDLLDATGTVESTGKAVGKDRARGKATAAAVLGVEGARARVEALHSGALEALRALGRPAPLLDHLAGSIAHRDR